LAPTAGGEASGASGPPPDTAPGPAPPLDHPRPDTPSASAGHGPAVGAAATVQQLTPGRPRAWGATLVPVLATVWSLLLSRYSGQDDVIFATATGPAVSGPELESVVGYSLTPLVLRVDLSGGPLLRRSGGAGAQRAARRPSTNLVPFERLGVDLNPRGGPRRQPDHQTMFTWNRRRWPRSLVVHSFRWRAHRQRRGQRQARSGTGTGRTPGGPHRGPADLRPRPVRGPTATRMVSTAAPGGSGGVRPTVTASTSFPSHGGQEHRQVVEWNATATTRPSSVVHHLVQSRAARQPTAPAVSAGGLEIQLRRVESTGKSDGRSTVRGGSAGGGGGDRGTSVAPVLGTSVRPGGRLLGP